MNVSYPERADKWKPAPAAAVSRLRIDIGSELKDGFAARLIQRKVNGLVLQGRLPRSEQPDWEQNLKHHLWRKYPQFNRLRGSWPTFVRVVIDHEIASLLDHRWAAMRHPCRVVRHLDAEDSGLSQVDDAAHARRTGCPRRSQREKHEMKHDIGVVLAGLSPTDRLFCSRLMQDSASEVARDLEIPDSTLRDRIRRLRPLFDDAGLRSYLS